MKDIKKSQAFSKGFQIKDQPYSHKLVFDPDIDWSDMNTLKSITTPLGDNAQIKRFNECSLAGTLDLSGLTGIKSDEPLDVVTTGHLWMKILGESDVKQKAILRSVGIDPERIEVYKQYEIDERKRKELLREHQLNIQIEQEKQKLVKRMAYEKEKERVSIKRELKALEKDEKQSEVITTSVSLSDSIRERTSSIFDKLMDLMEHGI